MSHIDETLALVKELHSYSIMNSDDYYSEKLLQIIIFLSTLNLTEDTDSKLSNDEKLLQNEIAKVKRKVPKWMKKTHQYNYQILKAFMELSDNNADRVEVDALEKYVDIGQAFLANYNNLKTISEKNHGKVFEEIDKEVELWEPVAKFIENIFEEKEIMNKKIASKIINNDLGLNRLDPENNGNVKWANINSKKNVYWINIHIDERLNHEYHFILNNKNKREFIYMVIPPNIFKDNLFVCRFDRTNGLDKYDVELSVNEASYLKDIKSGGSGFSFSKFVTKVYQY